MSLNNQHWFQFMDYNWILKFKDVFLVKPKRKRSMGIY